MILKVIGCVYIPDKMPSLNKKLEKTSEKPSNTKKETTARVGRKEDAIMLDINDLLEALKTRVEQFPDRSAKWLLENTENLRGLLEIIAGDIVECLDFSKVEIKRTTFIPDNLREQESDLVYLLPFRDEDKTGTTSEVLVYILLEHQSTVDRTMGFRLLFYMCQIWDSQRREFMSKNLPKREWRFQPIIPIVFYTGDQKWDTFPSLETLMDSPEALSRFVPKFDTLMLDVKRAADETLMQMIDAETGNAVYCGTIIHSGGTAGVDQMTVSEKEKQLKHGRKQGIEQADSQNP